MFIAILVSVCVVLSCLDSGRAVACDYYFLEKVYQMQLKIEAIEKQTQNAELIRNEMKRDIQELKEMDSVKKPLVAFSVYGSSSYIVHDGKIVVFQEVQMNDGGGYNKSSGVFTAPFSGLYQFAAHLCNVDQNYVSYAIVHNETEVALSTKGNTQPEGCNSVSALLKMKIGDNAKVRTTYFSAIKEDRWRRASFIGVLIHT